MELRYAYFSITNVSQLQICLCIDHFSQTALKAIPFFKANGNTLGTLKDWVKPAVSNGITIAKDTSISGATLSAQNDLNTNLGNLIKIWTVTIDQYNKYVFNGTDSSISALYNSVDVGKVLEPGFSEDELDVQNTLEKTIYGFLIPQAWPLSNLDIFPVVVYVTAHPLPFPTPLLAGISCRCLRFCSSIPLPFASARWRLILVHPNSDAKAPCGTPNPIDQYISGDDGLASYVCYDGGLYYLVGATGGAGDSLDCGDSGGDGTAVACTDNTLPVMPGVDQLDGKAWGGVLRDDLVAGAVNSYRAAGNENGGPPADPTNEGTLDDIFNNGIRAAGVIQIPVCTADEAQSNWSNIARKGKSVHFPCD